MEIVDAKLTLKCEDGTELKADMTDAKVAAIVQSCSYHVVEMDEGKQDRSRQGSEFQTDCRVCLAADARDGIRCRAKRFRNS